MSVIEHPLLGMKVDYNSLKAKQQESYNLQKVSAIFAEYGYLIIKLSDDWNGADFIALQFGTDKYIKVQLKARLSFNKKYLNKNINICFYDRDSCNWYLYPHDELCKIIMKKHEGAVAWRDRGEYHFPNIGDEDKKTINKYLLKP